jgi:hypothetical protein
MCFVCFPLFYPIYMCSACSSFFLPIHMYFGITLLYPLLMYNTVYDILLVCPLTQWSQLSLGMPSFGENQWSTDSQCSSVPAYNQKSSRILRCTFLFQVCFSPYTVKKGCQEKPCRFGIAIRNDFKSHRMKIVLYLYTNPV